MRTTFKKITFTALSLVCLWVLSVSLYFLLVPAEALTDAEQTQLSRIDFKQPLSAAQGDAVRSFVGTLPAVKATYFNYKDNIFVYTYAVGKQNSQAVFEAVQAKFHFSAERYLVSAAQQKTGCPISADRRAFSYRMVRYFSTVF